MGERLGFIHRVFSGLSMLGTSVAILKVLPVAFSAEPFWTLILMPPLLVWIMMKFEEVATGRNRLA